MIKAITAIIVSLAINISAATACTFMWDPPTTYTDGSPITETMTYKIYFTPAGTTATQLVYNGTTAQHTFVCLAGSYYTTAYTANASESGKSNTVVLKQVTPPANVKYGN